MISTRLTIAAALAASFLATAEAQDESARPLLPGCSEVVEKLKSDIAAEPSKMLLAVENALTVNESCACEIIRAAIIASRADEELVGEIVFAAVNAAPAQAARILECSLQAAPQAAASIRNAMQKALGGRAPEILKEKGAVAPAATETAPASGASGKDSVGKQPTGKTVAEPPADDEEAEVEVDFGPVGPTGIYLVHPHPGLTGTVKDPGKRIIIREIPPKRRRIHRPVPPGGVSPTGS